LVDGHWISRNCVNFRVISIGLSLVDISLLPIQVQSQNGGSHGGDIFDLVANLLNVFSIGEALVHVVDSELVKVEHLESKWQHVSGVVLGDLSDELGHVVIVLIEGSVDNVKHDGLVLALVVGVVNQVDGLHGGFQRSLITDGGETIISLFSIDVHKEVNIVLHPVTHALLINWVLVIKAVESLDHVVPDGVVCDSHEFGYFHDVFFFDIALSFVLNVFLLV